MIYDYDYDEDHELIRWQKTLIKKVLVQSQKSNKKWL